MSAEWAWVGVASFFAVAGCTPDPVSRARPPPYDAPAPPRATAQPAALPRVVDAEDAAADAPAVVALVERCVPSPPFRSTPFTYEFDLPPCDPGEGVCTSDHRLRVKVVLSPFEGLRWVLDGDRLQHGIAYFVGHAAARANPDHVVRQTVVVRLADGDHPQVRPRGDGDLPYDLSARLRGPLWEYTTISLCGPPDGGAVELVVTFTAQSRRVK